MLGTSRSSLWVDEPFRRYVLLLTRGKMRSIPCSPALLCLFHSPEDGRAALTEAEFVMEMENALRERVHFEKQQEHEQVCSRLILCLICCNQCPSVCFMSVEGGIKPGYRQTVRVFLRRVCSFVSFHSSHLLLPLSLAGGSLLVSLSRDRSFATHAYYCCL